ncbi:hypothetical protein Mnod_4035 [Methylobacterium nodulans ORS 2060]|uniref:Uncharacterized protein n=1 Tax=Methylobacterium nodulans (strain LMG 21967 / CNCM I-2342 / ORS 2060) TaxID=460265 RepID=B8ITK1_METNO|nr:hypothetical protein Mnod_4035 [Methylobacterium nodulans ORS 2060]
MMVSGISASAWSLCHASVATVERYLHAHHSDTSAWYLGV